MALLDQTELILILRAQNSFTLTVRSPSTTPDIECAFPAEEPLEIPINGSESILLTDYFIELTGTEHSISYGRMEVTGDSQYFSPTRSGDTLIVEHDNSAGDPPPGAFISAFVRIPITAVSTSDPTLSDTCNLEVAVELSTVDIPPLGGSHVVIIRGSAQEAILDLRELQLNSTQPRTVKGTLITPSSGDIDEISASLSGDGHTIQIMASDAIRIQTKTVEFDVSLTDNALATGTLNLTVTARSIANTFSIVCIPTTAHLEVSPSQFVEINLGTRYILDYNPLVAPFYDIRVVLISYTIIQSIFFDDARCDPPPSLTATNSDPYSPDIYIGFKVERNQYEGALTCNCAYRLIVRLLLQTRPKFTTQWDSVDSCEMNFCITISQDEEG